MNALHLPAALVESLGWVLVHSVWQLALIAAVAWVVDRLLCRRSAASRYVMLVLALAAMTVAPVVTFFVLPTPQPVVVAEEPGQTTELETRLAVAQADNRFVVEPQAPLTLQTVLEMTRVAPAGDEPETPPAAMPTAAESFWQSLANFRLALELALHDWLPAIDGFWLVGVFVFAWRPLVGLREVQRLRRLGQRPIAGPVAAMVGDLSRRMKLSRAVRVFESTRVRVPVMVGYLRPMILLPVSLVSQLPVGQLEAILAHELAHVRRHDYVVNLWQTLVETVLFYHPAVWWLSSRIRTERENCCDDIAVAVVQDRIEFSRALLAVAELRGPQTALVLGAGSGSLLARVRRLFPGEGRDQMLGAGSGVAFGLLAAMIVAVALWAAALAQSPDDADDPAVAEGQEDVDFVDAVSDRFATALAQQKLPYVTPDILTALRIELRDYLATRVTRPLSGPARDELLAAIDRFVTVCFRETRRYDTFRDNFDALKWSLWAAGDRSVLTPDELQQRDAQRQWMRDYLASLPADPQETDSPDEQHAAALAELDQQVFGNPLNFFFDDPMSAEEFDAFKAGVARWVLPPSQPPNEAGHPLSSTPGFMFIEGATARMAALQKRRPPGFAVNGNRGMANVGWGGGPHFTLNYLFPKDASGSQYVRDSLDGERVFYDAATNYRIDRPANLDDAAKEAWLAKQKQGDICFDAAARRLIPVRGARLTTIDATEWYQSDRFSLADLRRRLETSPLEFYSLAEVSDNPAERTPFAGIKGVPILVLESAQGEVVLLKIFGVGREDVQFFTRHRPLPPNPPFNYGDFDSDAARAAAAVNELVDAISDRVAAAIERQKLPYMTPVALASLRADMHDYLAEHVKQPLFGPKRAKLLDAIDGFVQRNFSGAKSYLDFRANFDTLRWQIWTATEERSLTAEESAELASQRQWMRNYIRGLPPQSGLIVPEWQPDRRIALLESNVFNNPLSPFFREPMTAEEFETFKFEVQKGNDLPSSPARIFCEVVKVRCLPLQDRWPSNFTGGWGSITNERDFTLQFAGPQNIRSGVALGRFSDERRRFYAVRGGLVEQPAPFDEESTERWLATTTDGDVGFDGNIGRLFAVHGARLAVLDVTEWYAADRIPLVELQRRLADSPLEEYELPAIPPLTDPGREAALDNLPLVAVEDAEGNIGVLKILHQHMDEWLSVQARRRPLVPYLPFNPGDAADGGLSAAVSEMVDAISDRVAAAIERQKLPYITPAARAWLRLNMHDYLAEHVKQPLFGQKRAKLLAAIDAFAVRNFTGANSYLGFRVNFDTLRWQIWTATEERRLTAEETAEVASQRQWMREYIRSLRNPGFVEPEWTPEGRIAVLESEVFDNPLSSFFRDPMTPEEFEKFKTHVRNSDNLMFAPAYIFQGAVAARIDALQDRWPPEFAKGWGTLSGTLDFTLGFRRPLGNSSAGMNLGESDNDGRGYFEVAGNTPIRQPTPLDEESTERWLATTKDGDLGYDSDRRRLFAVHGARLAALDVSEWYAADRIPLVELQRRLADSPLEEYELPAIPPMTDPGREAVLENLPLVAVEDAEGNIGVLKIVQHKDEWLSIAVRSRPLVPYLPFHPGDAADGGASAAVSEMVDTISDRVAAAIERQKLPYITPAARAWLRADMHDYLAEHVKKPLFGEKRAKLLAAIDAFAERKFVGAKSYLSFRINFETLRWRIWTATDERPLTAEETTELASQRQWMRDYIRGLPVDPKLAVVAEWHPDRRVAWLENHVFDNPLSPFFRDPMTAEEFDKFKLGMQKYGSNSVPGAPAAIFAWVVTVRCAALQERWPSDFTGGFKTISDGLDFTLQFAGRWNTCLAFNLGKFNADGEPKGYYDVSKARIEQPTPSDESPSERWPAPTIDGDVGFDANRGRLFAVHGAHLAVLDATQWYLADRIPLAELRRRLAESPQAEYELPAIPPGYGPGAKAARDKAIDNLPLVAVEDAEGNIAVLRIEPQVDESLEVVARRRPLVPYLPFQPGDDKAPGQTNDAALRKPDATASSANPAAKVDLSGGFVDAVADRFVAALGKAKLPYVAPEHVAALRAELREYLVERVKTPPESIDLPEILKAVDRFAARRFSGQPSHSYLAFRGNFNMLKWQLWTATQRRALSPQETSERESQREWMRGYVRGLPLGDSEGAGPEWSHEGRLQAVATDVFADPLSPFFHDPMSAEEFDGFKKRLRAENWPLKAAPLRIFQAAAQTRADALQKLWPPGFPVTGNVGLAYADSIDYGGGFFSFCASTFGPSGGFFLGVLGDGSRPYFDVAENSGVQQPAPLDDKATSAWLAENKQGDIWFDPASRRLSTVHGAKLTTILETEWYNIDKLSTAELRRRVAESPLDDCLLPAVSGPHDNEQWGWPTVVVASAKGDVAVLRFRQVGNSPDRVYMEIHGRPLPAYAPFVAGDVADQAKEKQAELAPEVAPPAAAKNEPAKVGFYIGEEKPGEGLTEAQAPRLGEAKIYLHAEPVLTREDIAETSVGTDNAGKLAINFTLSKAGAVKMGEVTKKNLNKWLAAVVDGKVVFAAVIRSQITESGVITGTFTQAEAEQIAKGISVSVPAMGPAPIAVDFAVPAEDKPGAEKLTAEKPDGAAAPTVLSVAPNASENGEKTSEQKAALKKLSSLGADVTIAPPKLATGSAASKAPKYIVGFTDAWRGSPADWKLLEGISQPGNLSLMIGTDRVGGLADVRFARPIDMVVLSLPTDERVARLGPLPASRALWIDGDDLSLASYHKLIAGGPDLKEVSISGAPKDSDVSGAPKGSRVRGTADDVAAELAAHAKGLTWLNLGAPISTVGLKAVGALENLEQLRITPAAVGPDDVAPLAALRRLERLYVGRSDAQRDRPHREDEILVGNEFARVAAALPALLVFDQASYMDREGLEALSTAMKLQLVSIQLDTIDDAGLAALAKLTQLRQLRVGGKSELTDGGLAPLEKLLRLVELDLPGDGLTDATLTHLAPLAKLKRLELMDGKFTGGGLAKLSPLEQLETLNVAGTNIDDEGCKALVAALPTLSTLSLSEAKITDIGVLELAKLANLSRLNLDGTKVTNVGLVELQRLKKLTALSVSNTWVTEKGIDALRKALPKLSVTDANFAPIAPGRWMFDSYSTVGVEPAAEAHAEDKSVEDKPAAEQPKEAAPKEDKSTDEKVLHFPADRSMGIVEVREATENGYVYGAFGKEWKPLGEARGDLRVPVGKEVQLKLSKGASSDLSGLDGLAADDLQVFSAGSTDVNDEQLAHVGRLTGLLMLDLESCPITDAGFGKLAGLKELRFANLEAFHVHKQGFGVGDESLKVLATMPKLQAIRLRLCERVTAEGMKALAPLKSLSNLTLAGTKIGDAGLVYLKQLPALDYLRLGIYREGADVTDEGLKTIGAMVQLKSLDLSGNKISDAGLVHLAGLSRLKHLSLDDTGIGEAGLANLEPLQALETLRLYTGKNITDVGAAHLAKLKSLRRIVDNLQLTDAGVAELAKLPHLEELELLNSKITIEGAKQIAGMQALEWLHFQRCPIGDAELDLMCDLPNVEYLQLSDTHVSGDGMQALARLPKLEILIVDFGDREEQPAGLKPHLKYISKLPHLKDLRLRGYGIDNNDLETLTWLSDLEKLQLNWPVNDAGAMHVAGCRHLKSLEMQGSVITDKGLKQLSNLKELTFLDISGHISDQGLKYLAKLKSLWGMQIQSPYITEEGLKALQKQLPALQYCNQWHDTQQDAIVISEKDSIRRYGTPEEREKKDPLEDKSPPPMHLADWKNTEPAGLDMAGLKGSVVLVDFWGTWCGPCRALTPRLKALDEKYRTEGLIILGVHTENEAEKMPAYLAENKIGWPQAVDVAGETAEAWKVSSWPTLFLIDRWGKLRMAGIYRDDLEAAVAELIAEKQPPTADKGAEGDKGAEEDKAAADRAAKFVYTVPFQTYRLKPGPPGGITIESTAEDEPEGPAIAVKTGPAEVTILASEADEHGLIFFDIETGKTFKPPFPLGPVSNAPVRLPEFVKLTPKLKDWIEQNHIDVLFHFDKDHWKHVTFGMEMDSVGQPDLWGPAMGMVEASRHFDRQDAKGRVSGEFPSSATHTEYREDVGTVEVFRTRDKAIGVMRWTGIDKPERGVKIEYRLMAPSTDLSRGRAHNYEIHRQAAARGLVLNDNQPELFADADFSQADLAGAKLIGKQKAFAGSRFSQADLTGATLVGGDDAFQRAQFDGAKLSNAILKGDKSSFFIASFEEADLSGAKWSGYGQLANFAKANLKGATLEGVGEALKSSTFAGADLSGAKILCGEKGAFRLVDINGTNFADADLSSLSPVSLVSCQYNPTTPPTYNRGTQFPAGFNPVKTGWKLTP